MAPQPGILYVKMAPEPSLPPAQFHDWYQNDHGPTRLRYPFFENGFRYRASDKDTSGQGQAEWMAIYNVTDMNEMTKEPYTALRAPPEQAQRERDTMKQIKVDRRFYDFVSEWVSPTFKKMDDIDQEGNNQVLVAVSTVPHAGKEEELDKWYAEEHAPLLQKVPGWRRTRRFVTSSVESGKEREFLALHEYDPQNGLGGPEHQAAMSTPWQKDIMANAVKDKARRVYNLYYTFGPAPRDIGSLADPSALPKEELTDKMTRTFSATATGSYGVVESYVTTSDGTVLPYRLEGSPDPQSPLIVCVNSVLVTYGIWDGFVNFLLADPQNRKYRVLRYNSRGRLSNTGQQSVTIDVLASDIVALLDALRVPKAAAAIGVSLGGITVLNAGLKHPQRIGSFVSCDTNAKSPAGNSKAWGDRIAIAGKEGLKAASGEPIVGSELAEMTVSRWNGGNMGSEYDRIKDMVINNSFEGFRKGVQALFDYDVKEEMKAARTKGMFVVGSQDGVLPNTMKEMAEGYNNGTKLHVVEGAGHLPMVEKPEEFASVVSNFLSS